MIQVDDVYQLRVDEQLRLRIRHCSDTAATWTQNGEVILLTGRSVGVQRQCRDTAIVLNTLLDQRLPTVMLLAYAVSGLSLIHI